MHSKQSVRCRNCINVAKNKRNIVFEKIIMIKKKLFNTNYHYTLFQTKNLRFAKGRGVFHINSTDLIFRFFHKKNVFTTDD